MDLTSLAAEPFCYLTTTGRVSGEPREIEIWFAVSGGTLFLLAGGRDKANWVRNIQKRPNVSIRIKDQAFLTQGRVVDPASAEDALARQLLVGKYQPGNNGDLANWGRTALPVAFDLNA